MATRASGHVALNRRGVSLTGRKEVAMDINFDSNAEMVDSDLRDHDDYPPPSPTTETRTMSTISPTSTTSPSSVFSAQQAAQTISNDGETIIVMPPPPRHERNGKLSENTEHLLIAAGSIGATIVLVLIIYGIYAMRKRGMTFNDLLHYRSYKARCAAAAAAEFKHQSYRYDSEERSKSLPTAPPETILRCPTNASNRPLIAPQPRLPSRTSTRSPIRDDSESRDALRPLPTSTQLPRAYTAQHTRTPSDASETYIIQSTDSPTSPEPPARTQQTSFAQFLAKRGLPTPKNSRFSWNTSQAAPTPRDANFNRQSSRTSRSSVPRWRTVESWVNSQSSRSEAERLRREFAAEQEQNSQRARVESDPPNYVSEDERGRGYASEQREPAKQDRRRRETAATQSTEATVFRHHPGTKIPLPRGSLVPSEVLNSRTRPPSL